MKKLFLVTILFFSLIGISYASNTIYLKCPQVITDNKSNENSAHRVRELSNWVWNVGQKMNTNFAKIKLGKSKASITSYHYKWIDSVEELNDKKSLGKPITTFLWYVEGDNKTFKVKKDENGYLVIDQSNKLMGLPTDKVDVMHKMTWFEKSNKWHFKEVLIAKVHKKKSITRLKSEGTCEKISKKDYKNYLKNGEGLDFFNTVYTDEKTTYLRCPLMMVENKGRTYDASYWKVGDNLNELYAKVVEAKKTRISMHLYSTGKDYWKDSKPNIYEGLLENIVFKRINNELKWSDSNSTEFNDKELGKVVGKTNDSYKFNNINNKWSLTLLQYEEFIIEKDSSQNIHVSHKLGSDCFQIDEKLYKNFIENGKV
jgi:hypothetical protein